MPNLRVQNLGASLKVLAVDNTDLTRNRRVTYLTEDVVATGKTLRVQSLVGINSLSVSSGQILCVAKISDEKTEVINISSSIGISSRYYKEITLDDVTNDEALKFDHPQDTPVYVIDWNRVEFAYSGTASGTKSTLRAYPVNLEPDCSETSLQETDKDQVFYFARFHDSINNRYSGYTDGVYSTGYDDNSVYAIKKNALEGVGEEVDGNIITHEYLNSALWVARREYHKAPGKRPFRRKYNTVIGTAYTGSYRIELPTDVEKPYTAENIYGVRIGTQDNMRYIDKKQWDFYYQDKPHSTLELPYTAGTSTSIWLANGRDFSGSAVITVEGTQIACKTKASGSHNSFYITTHGDWDCSAGSDAWENITLGLPDKFTVFADPSGSAYIYFNQPLSTDYIDQNIYCDYYRTLVGYDSDGDILDEPKYDMYQDYLRAVIKHRKKKGETDITQDPDYKLWLFKKAEALSDENLETDITLEPGVDHLPIPD